MRLCLTCYVLSPSGSLFCASCGRSFGGRACPRRHLSPSTAAFCTTCGSTELTAPTAFLGLGCLSLAVWIALAALVAAWLWEALQSALHAPAAAAALRQGIAGAIAIGIALGLIPGQTGRRVRRTLWRACARLARSAWRLVTVGLFYRLLREGIREARQASKRRR